MAPVRSLAVHFKPGSWQPTVGRGEPVWTAVH